MPSLTLPTLLSPRSTKSKWKVQLERRPDSSTLVTPPRESKESVSLVFGVDLRLVLSWSERWLVFSGLSTEVHFYLFLFGIDSHVQLSREPLVFLLPALPSKVWCIPILIFGTDIQEIIQKLSLGTVWIIISLFVMMQFIPQFFTKSC